MEFQHKNILAHAIERYAKLAEFTELEFMDCATMLRYLLVWEKTAHH